MPLNKTPEEILALYRERTDSLDASSYEVEDLCEAVITLREALAFYATRDGGDRARRTLLTLMSPTNSEPEYKRRANEAPR